MHPAPPSFPANRTSVPLSGSQLREQSATREPSGNAPWYLAPAALALLPRVRPAIERWHQDWISGREHHAAYIGPEVDALFAHWGALYREQQELGEKQGCWPDDADDKLHPAPEAVLGAVFGDPGGNPDQPGYEWRTTNDQSAAWERIRDDIERASRAEAA